MPKPHWFPFYVADWRASRRVQAMAPLARWIYFALLCEQFDAPTQSLPDVPAELAAVTGVTLEEFADHWPSVRPCFAVRVDGRLENLRLKDETVTITTRLARYSKRGQRAAAERWARWARQEAQPGTTDPAQPYAYRPAYMHTSVYSTHSTDSTKEPRGAAAPASYSQKKPPRSQRNLITAAPRYLAACPHNPPCTTPRLCGDRRALDQAVRSGAVDQAQADRLLQLWGVTPRMLPASARPTTKTRRQG